MQARALGGWSGISVCARSFIWMFIGIGAMLPVSAGLTATPSFAESTLVITDAHGKSTELTATQLSARPDFAAIDAGGNGDIYHHSVAYRGVPLLSLLTSLGDTSTNQADTLEAEAADGFVSQIPFSLIAGQPKGSAVAWIAIEDGAHPWPSLLNGEGSAGPFYLVWEHPERSGVSREQWPYKLKKLTLVVSPLHRWPQLAVNAALPVNSPARRGQDVFIANCLPCHRMKRGGAGVIGPDLGEPMAVTQYLSDTGLKAIVRNPAAVRTWPGQQMIGFGKVVMPDADLDALVAYLHAMSATTASVP